VTPGTRLGPYEIVALIGAGGMGEVYRARDSRLDRDVAIKVLPNALSADPEARARFEREARAVSQLNHPHICALYDVGRRDDAEFLVMEYLEGESLAARLARGPLSTAEALDYGVQIADALDKAHRRGIVHRDLKPANVMLTKGGAARSVVTSSRTAPSIAKLLDFGLAKLAPPPTIASKETVLAANAGKSVPRINPATAEGTILGTFEYMAPEQVEGGEVDARADIWALGCVLYEMITGRRAFEGKTQASVIAGVLSRDPTPVAELQPLAPPALGRVIRICLAKDPDARFQSSYDVLLQLQWIAEGGSAAGLPAPVVERRKRRERTLWLAGAATAVAAAAAGAWLLKPAPVISNVSEHWAFTLPEGQNFTRPGRRYLAISPDGRRFAYIANQQIYLREIDQLDSHPVPGTNEDPLDVMFSPDGQWMAYFVPNVVLNVNGDTATVLKKIRITAGTPVNLCTTGFSFGASWEGHTIVFAQNSDRLHGIAAVPDTPGSPATLITVGKDEQAAQPHLIAGGTRVLFAVRTGIGPGSWDLADVVVQAPDEAKRTVLVNGATDPHLVANRLIYTHRGTVFAIGMEPRDRATHGGPVPVIEGVQSTVSGSSILAIADNGTLVYEPGNGDLADQPRQLVWVDRQGREEKISAPERPYRHPRVSRDEKRIVVVVETSASMSLNTLELSRGVLQRLSPIGEQRDDSPVWTPDGRVIYRSVRPDGTTAIMRIDASGVSPPETLIDLGRIPSALGLPESVSPDGNTLTFRTFGLASDVMALRLDSADRTPQPLVHTPAFEFNGVISPDGHWLAYTKSDQGSAAGQIYVRPYPNVDANQWQVSSAPGVTSSGRDRAGSSST